MATSEGIPSSIDIEFLELNDNPYLKHFPHYKQHNASDCGPTSLRMIDSTLESKSFCRMLWH